MRNPIFDRVRSILSYALAACLALLISEAFLNAVLSRTLGMSLWFTGKIHTRDNKYGFRYSPNYDGWMRHSDRVFLVPLALDEHGYRLPAKRAEGDQNIVLIGGRSMTFSYGVPDDRTLHHAIGHSLHKPSTVHNTAWPGFGQYRNFHVYKDGLARDVDPDFAVIIFWRDTLATFNDFPEDFSTFLGNGSKYKDMFYYFDDIAQGPPTGRLRLAFGKLYFQSLIVNRLVDRLAKIDKAVSNVLHRSGASPVKAAHKSANLEGGSRFKKWTTYLQNYFGGKGKVLFVFMPCMYGSRPDFYDPMIAALPTDADYLDLNRSLGKRINTTGFVAGEHYSAASCELLGKTIAERINSINTRVPRPL